MADIELEEAIERSARNRASRWPERGAKNRLEPECWPELNPRFDFASGARVFTIGSCFARNVELHLASLGFDIPTRKFLNENRRDGVPGGDEILNKYTPPSIHQELAWTRRIRERDGIVSAADVEPMLLDLGDGKVVDMQHRLTNQFGMTRADALDQRRKLYGLFEQAFDSEIVIVTLGLIECWLDRANGQYVEFGPYMRRHNAGNRFVFRRLTFNEAYEFTKKTLDLLNADGPRNVLITTSPVPLARTFTADDVIVANAYSKSVLRAVAGQVAEEFANVDYFPSYETVMLTKQTYVWANDLTHVEGEFVGRIVSRLCERYVADAQSLPNAAALDRWLSFANLVNHGRFDEAKAIFAGLDLDEPGIAARFSLPLAEIRLHLGEAERAVADAQRARSVAQAAGERGCLDLLRCARVFEAAGHADEAETTRANAVAALGNPALIMSLIRRLSTRDTSGDLQRIVAHVEGRMRDNLDLLAFTAMTLEATGDLAGAERICRAGAQAHPRSADMLARLGHLLLRQKRTKRALSMLERALALEPNNPPLLKKLTGIYLEAEAFEQAERCARALVGVSPLDPAGHLNLASALRRSGRKREALEHARRAAELEPHNERYSRYVEELTRANAGRQSSPSR